MSNTTVNPTIATTEVPLPPPAPTAVTVIRESESFTDGFVRGLKDGIPYAIAGVVLAGVVYAGLRFLNEPASE